MREKIHSYMGFAKRSGNLVSGFESCMDGMKRKKIRLLIIAEDLSENTRKKLVRAAETCRVPYTVYSDVRTLSEMAGELEKGVYGITDRHFSEIINQEIQNDR